jgi:hypothetical protein
MLAGKHGFLVPRMPGEAVLLHRRLNKSSVDYCRFSRYPVNRDLKKQCTRSQVIEKRLLPVNAGFIFNMQVSTKDV